MAKLRIDNVALRFVRKGGNPVTALENISLEVEEEEFSVIVGPSGCGKTSLLRLVAGLIEPSEGSIHLDGIAVTRPGKDRGMVFQSYTLFPWLRVAENVEFGLKIGGVAPEERRRIAQHFISEVGLEGFERAYPKELSGGMMQRVALARALANDPEILLMDEPFSALDAQNKLLLQEELLRIWDEQKKTVVFITHSVDEAVFLGDRIMVMTAQPGRVKSFVRVPLDRPRNLIELQKAPEFGELVHRIWSGLRDEVQRAREQENKDVVP